MRWLSAVLVLSILSLAGCGSSANPDAPPSDAPHEAAWATYHRNDIVNTKGVLNNNSTVRAVVSGNLIKEHVIQCQACHGAELMGAKAGDAGPACLDCHVLDPVMYPVLCYSCHGGYPVVNPQQWYSTNRATRPGLPLNPDFFKRVDQVHLKHQPVPNAINYNDPAEIEKCAVCHGEKSHRGEMHHTVVMNNLKLGCLGPMPFGCHSFDPGTFTLETPECSFCHN